MYIYKIKDNDCWVLPNVKVHRLTRDSWWRGLPTSIDSSELALAFYPHCCLRRGGVNLLLVYLAWCHWRRWEGLGRKVVCVQDFPEPGKTISAVTQASSPAVSSEVPAAMMVYSEPSTISFASSPLRSGVHLVSRRRRFVADNTECGKNVICILDRPVLTMLTEVWKLSERLGRC